MIIMITRNATRYDSRVEWLHLSSNLKISILSEAYMQPIYDGENSKA